MSLRIYEHVCSPLLGLNMATRRYPFAPPVLPSFFPSPPLKHPLLTGNKGQADIINQIRSHHHDLCGIIRHPWLR